MRWKHVVALLVFGPMVAVSASACSLALGLGVDQCDSTADCTKRGFKNARCDQHVCVSDATGSTSTSTGAGGSDPAWSCLPGFTTPVASDTYPVQFQIVMATGGALPSDLVINLCSAFDASCTAPIQSNVTLDAMGNVTFMVAPTFGNGFLEITSPSMATYPALAYFGTPVLIPPVTEIIRLTTPAQLNALLQLTHLTTNPNDGISIVLTSDCQDQRTAGVTLDTTDGDSTTVPFYFVGNEPQPVPMATATDMEGAGGFLNLPPTVIKISAARASDSSFIGTASFAVRKGTISYVPIGPSTKP